MSAVRRTVTIISVMLMVASCGGSTPSQTTGTGTDPSGTAANNTAAVDTGAGLPAECSPAPYQVQAQRDGEQAAGSAALDVIGSAALPIPLVPNKAGTLTDAQVRTGGATTDLLGYAVFFGDEPFGPSDISMFGGYEPTAAGKSRGNVSIFPDTTTPIAVGDVLTPGTLDGLDMLTTFNRVNMDFKASPDELTAYLGAITGSVTVLGLTEAAICLDVDLAWEYSDFGSSALGTLTVRGTLTAPLAPRSVPFT